jgi:hypothetical protein
MLRFSKPSTHEICSLLKTNVLPFSRPDVFGASLLIFCIALFSPRLASATPTNVWLGGANAGTGTANTLSFGLDTLINAGIVTNTGTLGTNTLTNQAAGMLSNNGMLASGKVTNAGTFINSVGGTLTSFFFGGFTNNIKKGSTDQHAARSVGMTTIPASATPTYTIRKETK